MDEKVAMISVRVEKAGSWWFAVAYHGGKLVATAIGSDGEGAAGTIRRCIPHGLEYRFVEETEEYPRSVALLLARLEAGGDEEPRFELCPDCVPGPLAWVLRTAAAIPRGYVGTYGGIAAAANTVARAVGRVMATNPLYPIVPCHRVVGSDLSLVGYSGRQDAEALRAKRERLRGESKGLREEKVLAAAGGLRVFPVEWALAKAARDGLDAGDQPTLW